MTIIQNKNCNTSGRSRLRPLDFLIWSTGRGPYGMNDNSYLYALVRSIWYEFLRCIVDRWRQVWINGKGALPFAFIYIYLHSCYICWHVLDATVIIILSLIKNKKQLDEVRCTRKQ